MLRAMPAVLLASAAHADFTISISGLMSSAGASGNLGNSVFLYTYSGPDAVVTGGQFAGAISSIIRGTTIAEARWGLRNTRFGTSGAVSFSHNLGYFENSVLVTGNLGGGMILKSGDVLRLETFESFDDGPGADAVWNNVSWAFATTTPVDLGVFDAVSTLRTSGGAGFGTDTELALFDSDGLLLRWNDDADGGSGSAITGLSLADGLYYACVMPYDSAGTNGLVRPGYDGLGAYALSVNGAQAATGTLAAYANHWYVFRVGEECPTDYNGDGFVDFFDYDDFVAGFEAGEIAADFNADGFLDFFDYDAFAAAFEAGC